MFERLRPVFERIKRFTWAYIRFVQKILITVFLTLLYVFGFGLTRMLLWIFDRRSLRPARAVNNSYWHTAEDYEVDHENCVQQS